MSFFLTQKRWQHLHLQLPWCCCLYTNAHVRIYKSKEKISNFLLYVVGILHVGLILALLYGTLRMSSGSATEYFVCDIWDDLNLCFFTLASCHFRPLLFLSNTVKDNIQRGEWEHDVLYPSGSKTVFISVHNLRFISINIFRSKMFKKLVRKNRHIFSCCNLWMSYTEY